MQQILYTHPQQKDNPSIAQKLSGLSQEQLFVASELRSCAHAASFALFSEHASSQAFGVQAEAMRSHAWLQCHIKLSPNLTNSLTLAPEKGAVDGKSHGP